MLRTIFFWMFFSIFMVLSLIPLGITKMLGLLGLDESRKNFDAMFVRLWAKVSIFLTGSKLSVYNEDMVPNEAVLYVANHQSYGDIVATLAACPVFAPFIAKKELSQIPLLSWWMTEMGCLYLDRDNLRQQLKVIVTAIDRLKKGDSLVIFPEGTRSKGGKMGDFKPGSLKIAVKAGVKIVPVTIKNTYKMYEEKNAVSATQASILFHSPIDTKKLTKEEINKLHITVKNIIENALD